MFCRYCGKKVVDQAVFCSYCGQRVQNHSNEHEVEQIYGKHKNNNAVHKRPIGFLKILLLLIIVGGLLVFLNKNTIQGEWYLIEVKEGSISAPENYFNFLKGGVFYGDSPISGSYGIENGKLILKYNPLVGVREYDYKIKWGKLYLHYDYKDSEFVYSKVKPLDWKE